MPAEQVVVTPVCKLTAGMEHTKGAQVTEASKFPDAKQVKVDTVLEIL